MKNPLKRIALLMIVGLALGACATKVERISPEEVKDLSGQWNDTDSRLVSEEMINDVVSRAWLADFTQQRRRDPAVIVGGVRNLSHEHINVQTFVNDMERALINSGKVQFVASSGERQEIREERSDQDINASEETRNAMGKERGADFMLKGDISTILDTEGKRQVRFYQVDLTLISVSEQAAAQSVNDSQLAYAWAQYERIYVHIYAALNYLALGQLQEARVEALQIDTALGQIDKKEPVPAGFAYYLSGLVYEALGEWDDAMIDYRKAYEAYRAYPDAYHVPLPTILKEDLVRVAARQGFDDELARYREEFGLADDAARARSSGKGEVIVVLQTGLAPVKRDTIASVYAADGRLVTIALPYYQAREIDVSQATLRVSGSAAQTRTEPVEAVDRMAAAELEQEMPLITARAFARAVVKNKAIKQGERQGNEALGLVMNVAGIMTERADTRSWSTLPARIYIARLPLEPGRYDMTLELRNAAGVVVGTRAYNGLEIAAGNKHFISLHWLTAQDLALRDAYPRVRSDVRSR